MPYQATTYWMTPTTNKVNTMNIKVLAQHRKLQLYLLCIPSWKQSVDDVHSGSYDQFGENGWKTFAKSIHTRRFNGSCINFGCQRRQRQVVVPSIQSSIDRQSLESHWLDSAYMRRPCEGHGEGLFADPPPEAQRRK